VVTTVVVVTGVVTGVVVTTGVVTSNEVIGVVITDVSTVVIGCVGAVDVGAPVLLPAASPPSALAQENTNAKQSISIISKRFIDLFISASFLNIQRLFCILCPKFSGRPRLSL
jgi:hypothetical protein